MAKKIITIDGNKYAFVQGESILKVAGRNGIQIPSLCYDESFPHYTSCFVCIVKEADTGHLVPSCSTNARDGMNIVTSDAEIIKYRKMALELLLSEHDADCFAPCKTSCPAGIDVRDYILYTRNDDEFKGFNTIRKSNPLVSIVGRVCPAFCEQDCSRTNIDETVNIRLLKRHIGDIVYRRFDKKLFDYEKKLIKNSKLINKKAASKKVAIVGSGPAGLSAAYYMRLSGINVSIFEAMPKAGGMLRYAIPRYRLPEDVLDKEIKSITRLGVRVISSSPVDKDALEKLKKDYDKVIVAVGTWKETPLGLGEQGFANIIPALHFLKMQILKMQSNPDIAESIKGRVIVIGGGNSAVDAARTALRLGAKNVDIVYRRTRAQMPANSQEIDDALAEGIKLHELMSPAELIVDGPSGPKIAKKIKFTKMLLSSELDKSGRNKILDTEEFEAFDFDLLIYAIGQKPEPELMGNPYICGDAKNGATTVIEAVADGRKMAKLVIDEFYSASTEPAILDDGLDFYSVRQKGLLVKKDNDEIQRVLSKHLPADTRIKDFSEVELAYSAEKALPESKRCINCGCSAIDDCELRKYSMDYAADPMLYRNEDLKTGVKATFVDQSLGFMLHEPSKCIKCGRCINVCDNIAAAHALSFMGRGIDIVLSSNNRNNIQDSDCILCGMCIDHCPTGSLIESMEDSRWSDIKEKLEDCKGCILRCKIRYGYSDRKRVRARSFDTPICSIGRWGWMDDYKMGLPYYKGPVSNDPSTEGTNRDVLLRKKDIERRIPKGPYNEDFWKGFDLVATVSYSPKGDNPRVLYDLERLVKNGGKLVNISSKKDISKIKGAKKLLLIFSFLNYNKPLLKELLSIKKSAKVLPIYFQAITDKSNDKSR